MRPTKHITQTVKNRSLEEPVYVDEVFPEELSQEDLWARKEKTLIETIEVVSQEAVLDFEDEEEEEVHPIPATKPQPTNPAPPPRSYRVKIPHPAQRRPDNRRVSTQRPLPTELPRPSRKERHEERTGTWPVESEPRRNGLSPKERVVPSERFTPPVPNWETQRELPVKNDRRPSSGQTPDTIIPPPLLHETSVKPPPRQVFPVQNVPVSQHTANFTPLVDDTSDEKGSILDHGLGGIEPAQSDLRLTQLIERLPLPKNSLILGVCADGLPLILELSDPSPGALLFLGDDVEGVRNHLQAVLSSVCLLSDPKQVQIDIISPQPESFSAQQAYPHVQNIHLPDHEGMFSLLGCLFELIEQRQRQGNSLTGKLLKDFVPANKTMVRILMIDQLDILVEQLAPESLSYLRWLLRRGPAANVWVLASLNTQNAQTVDGKTLKSFGLQIAGNVQNTRQATRLTDIPLEKLSSLVTGEQACLKLDDDLIEFSILEY